MEIQYIIIFVFIFLFIAADVKLVLLAAVLAMKMDEETVYSGSTARSSSSGSQSLSQTLSGIISDNGIASYVEPLKPTHLIKDLKFGLTDWTIKARVTSKSRIIPPNSDRIKTFFNVDLSDGSGDIRATVFEDKVAENFDKLHNLLEIDRVYWFSNLIIEVYKSPLISNTYGLIFHKDAKVNLCQEMTKTCNEVAEETPNISYDFVPIKKIQSMHEAEFADVIGICVKADEVRVIEEKGIDETTRNIVLSDGLGNYVTVHVRGSQAENFDGSDNPIVAIKSGYISRFEVYEEGTIENRIITDYYRINPDIPETRELEKRRKEKEMYIY